MRILFFLLLFSFDAFSQSKIPNNTLRIGRGSSPVDKGFIFNTNDGADNENLLIEKVSKKLKFSGNSFQIGDQTQSSNKNFILDSTTGAAIRWDGAALTYSNDGTLFQEIGSGSGGGSSGINLVPNPRATQGLRDWTASKTGIFTEVTTATAVLEGEASFSFLPTAKDDQVCSAVRPLNAGLYQTACEASIYYINDGSLVSLQVQDEANNVIAKKDLKNQSVAGYESLGFLCPSQAQIAADANKGSLKLCLKQEGDASPSKAIILDSVHLGSFNGLLNSVSNDVIGFNLSGIDGSFQGTKPDIISTCTRYSLASYRCTYSRTLLEAPSVSIYTTGGIVRFLSNLTTQFTFEIRNSSGTAVNSDSNIIIKLKGDDSQPDKLVYQNFPVAAQNVNTFTFQVSSNGAVTHDFYDIINGNCVATVDSLDVCTFNSGIFTNAPSCNSSPTVSNYLSNTQGTTASTVRIRTTNDSGSAGARTSSKIVTCSKVGSDIVTPVVQPVVINQVQSGQNDPIAICRIRNQSQNATLNIESEDSCFGSASRRSAGVYVLSFASNYFKGKVSCFQSASYSTETTLGGSAFGESQDGYLEASGSFTLSTTNSSGSRMDSPWMIICFGTKGAN